MGKEKPGFLTPKAISNRIKAKGLQKLRWYCQMCQKQCRDENGFKCHLTSESHQRQLLLFAENPGRHIADFSREFFRDFMQLLRRHGEKRVAANKVYQEYISDRNHVHMNSTRWCTLTGFVNFLGREGICKVDQTEKGWFITYINRDPDFLERERKKAARKKMDMDDDEIQAKMIEEQIKRGAERAPPKEEIQPTELVRDSEEKIKVELSAAVTTEEKKPIVVAPLFLKIDEKPKLGMKLMEKKKTALDEIMEQEETRKEKQNRKENWLHENIVVKIITKKLGAQYNGKKGIITKVENDFTAYLKLIEDKTKIKCDQSHLETVIPAIGKKVMIVNGAYRGSEAVLKKLNESRENCTVLISSGLHLGRTLDIPYDDMSKLYQKE
ncbi:DgyrCDS7719 [Dimorphilus gyrociliatus]|uniref:DgyrCDS7719 n=1 Tax=Dimorphilus gyrociliatus TaxID=2664684 RepID=A0A7I8VTN1_9ANNE|nr:DgyrCDS7719 [Dimorphilus gyrociliatus]